MARRVPGVSYAVFRTAGTLTLYSTVAPGKPGECLEPETEQYDKGAGWYADTRYGCDKLDSASHDTAPFSLSQAPATGTGSAATTSAARRTPATSASRPVAVLHRHPVKHRATGA